MKALNPVQQFALYGGVCIGGLCMALGFATALLLEEHLLTSEWASTAEIVHYEIGERTLAPSLADPEFRQQPAKYREAFQALLRVPEVVGIKLWDQQATVLWSDDERLIGKRFPANHEVQEALAGRLAVELKTLPKDEEEYWGEEFMWLAEIYIPIRVQPSGEILGVIEVYKQPARLAAAIHRMRVIVWGIALFGGGVLYGVLLVIARHAYRRQLELEARLQDRAENLEALVEQGAGRLPHLNALSQLVASSLEERPVFDCIVRAAAGLIGDSVAILWILYEATQELTPQAATGIRHPHLQRGIRIPLGTGQVGEAAATGRLVTIQDVAEDTQSPNWEWAIAEGLHAAAYIPLIREGRSRGVLGVLGRFRRAFTAHELELLTSFANQAAIALENARLFTEVQRRNRELQALFTVTNTVTRSLDVASITQAALRTTIEVLHLDAGRLYIFDGKNNVLRLSAHHGIPAVADMLRPYERYAPGEGIVGRIFQEGRPIVFADMATDPNYAAMARSGQGKLLGFRSAAGIPILNQGRPVGVIYVFGRAVRDFSPEDLALLSAIGGQVGIAIENARLHEDTQRRAREATALAEVGRTLGSSLDPDRVLDLIVQETQRVLGASFAGVMTLDEASQALMYAKAAGLSLEHVATVRLKVGEGLAGLALAQGGPMQSSRLLEDPRYLHRDVAEREGFRSLLCVPLLAGGRSLGTLVVFRRDEHEFSPAEVELLSSFANQASLALENARLFGEIRQHAATLEARVKERTAELEEALRAKSRFLATMSHELRTPLNAILGFSELLLRQEADALTPRQERYTQFVHRGGQQLLGLVSELLEMAEAQTGQAAFHLEYLPLAQFLETLVGSLALAAKEKQVEVQTALDPGLPAVVADRRKLAKALHHVVSNAIRYTPAGGRVTVSVGRVSSPQGDEAEIAVTDTGIGIRPEDLERIFQPFEQADSSETRRYGGAGLGLAVVRHLVGRHGGRVWAESEGEGHGARFIVRLPLLAAPLTPRILVTGDVASVSEALSATFRDAGYEAEQARTGAEVLERLAATTFGLLVLDIGLPDGGGWNTLTHVREMERLRKLPVLVLAGPGSMTRDQALTLGADEFLVKPVSPRALVETAARLLARPAILGAAGEGKA